MTNYTDLERKQIAEQEYNKKLKVGKEITINRGAKTIGTVREVITDKTGLKAYVVESPDKKEVSLLYQGSAAPPKKGAKVDWLDNDFPMAKNIVTGTASATPQLKSASKVLNQVLTDYPHAKVTIYGHSLGSMNAQYALANVSDPDRIAGAYIYEGPNVYPALTQKQKKTVDGMKYRIHNYIDQRDIVPIGYDGRSGPGYKAPKGTSKEAVGIVYRVDGKFNLNPVDQHMWGGYQWKKDGSLKLKEDSSGFESRYSASLDTVATGLYDYSLLKTSLKSGGLTGHEQFYLDSEQAQTVASGLTIAAQTGQEALASLYEQVIAEAEELYASLETVPLGITLLSPEEVKEAYAEAGVNYQSIVGDVAAYFEEKVRQAEALTSEFSKLENNIQSGIEEAVAKDSKLAASIASWSQGKTGG